LNITAGPVDVVIDECNTDEFYLALQLLGRLALELLRGLRGGPEVVRLKAGFHRHVSTNTTDRWIYAPKLPVYIEFPYWNSEFKFSHSIQKLAYLRVYNILHSQKYAVISSYTIAVGNFTQR
jgi:hypothetical protein